LVPALRPRRHGTLPHWRCRRKAAALLATIALVLLSGCSWMPFIGSKSNKPTEPACPVAAILRPLANTVVFGPGADRNPTGVAWYGILSDVSVTCQIKGDTLHAALDIVIAAEHAPAAKTDGPDLNYFVALTGSDQSILGMTRLSVHVTVPEPAKRGGVSDHVEVAFATGGRPMSDLTIDVGFQQTADAIEFYKKYRGR